MSFATIERTSLFLLVLLTTSCASPHGTPSVPPAGAVSGGAGAPLRGDLFDHTRFTMESGPTGAYRAVKGQPFQAASAWGRWRGAGAYANNVIVTVYEQPVAAGEACSLRPPKGRKVQVEMPWPLPPGSVHSSIPSSNDRPNIAVFDDASGASARWEGEVRVSQSDL